jgi:hypothetical protein
MSAVIVVAVIVVMLMFLVLSIMHLSGNISEEERTREDAKQYKDFTQKGNRDE